MWYTSGMRPTFRLWLVASVVWSTVILWIGTAGSPTWSASPACAHYWNGWGGCLLGLSFNSTRAIALLALLPWLIAALVAGAVWVWRGFPHTRGEGKNS